MSVGAPTNVATNVQLPAPATLPDVQASDPGPGPARARGLAIVVKSNSSATVTAPVVAMGPTLPPVAAKLEPVEVEARAWKVPGPTYWASEALTVTGAEGPTA